MALVDTTVLIDLSRPPRTPAHRRASGLVARVLRSGDTLYTSRLNEAEFRVGAMRAGDPAAEEARIETVLAGFVILEFDAACALRFAAAKAYLLQIGRPAGDLDVLIASVALANAEPLVTRNPKHFADIPGLRVDAY